MNVFEYTTIDRITAKLYREFKDGNIDPTDVVEWVGEALDFLKVPDMLEEVVTVRRVTNHHCDMPCALHMILQIARSTQDVCPSSCKDPECDCEEQTSHMSYFDWFSSPLYKEFFTPVRLSNHSFFNSIVCRELDHERIYHGIGDEYTIVGTVEKKLRFSFKEGWVAISYLRNPLDEETGFPLIPDNVSYINAIFYYIKWKMAERHVWVGKGAFRTIEQAAMQTWMHYARQAKNYAKMPKMLDEYQNRLEESHQLIPKHKRYYARFSNLGRMERFPYKEG